MGHGCQGREEVINLKMEYFRACSEKGLPTYSYLDFFCVDLENSCVRFGFHCLIPGSEGKGTELLHFDEVTPLPYSIVHKYSMSNLPLRMEGLPTFSTSGMPLHSRPGLLTRLTIFITTLCPVFTTSSLPGPPPPDWTRMPWPALPLTTQPIMLAGG